MLSAKANVTATFSDAMDADSLDAASGRLSLARKDSARATAAGICLNAAKTKVTLDPDRKLRPGATYVATLGAGAKDEGGNATATGRTWRVTIKK